LIQRLADGGILLRPPEPTPGANVADYCAVILTLELDLVYVDVAVLRWQAFTGEEAVLEADGRSFAEVAEERDP
jgi:hypothetical protein